ncbi:MAG TPA: glycosyl hydrolase 108 family protein [Methylocella sp.]|nr:glycosyl hydrolase 108 family protein [Methylocella sp.]
MAKSNYEECVAFVRRQEGGNTNAPGDPGGRTGRGGITHITYDSYRASKGLAPRDVFEITDEEIAEIYEAHYWMPIYGDRLPAGQDLALFDFAVNSGPAKANEARIKAGDAPLPELIKRICAHRLSFLHSLGTWKRFGRVWGNRVADCEANALRMASSLTTNDVEAAKEKKIKQKRRARQVVIAAAAGGGALHQIAIAGEWVLAVFGLGATAFVGIAMFNAWRQGQRADSLSRAVEQMQMAANQAANARDSVAKQIASREADITKQQEELAKSKEAVREVLASQMTPASALQSESSQQSSDLPVLHDALLPGLEPTQAQSSTAGLALQTQQRK